MVSWRAILALGR